MTYQQNAKWLVDEGRKRRYSRHFLRIMGGYVVQHPELFAKCDLRSVLLAFDAIENRRLDPDPQFAEAYVVPYGRQAKMIIGYMGWVKLARMTGQINDIDADIVYEGDKFSWKGGLNQDVDFEPSTLPGRSKRPITHIFACAELKNGRKKVRVWEPADIDEHKKRFSASWQKQDSAWQTNWGAMAKKTVLRQLVKMLPLGESFRQEIENDEAIEAEWMLQEITEERPAQITQEPAQQPQEQAKEKPAAGITERGQERLDALAADLENCEDITTVQQRLETSISASESVEEELAAKTMADTRAMEIRGQRGERSNKKQKQL